jgi:hypothetical protein
MRRLHLIELEDHDWCPAAVRDAATDYLQYGIEQMQPYRAIAPRLKAALQQTKSKSVLDLCSGGGGPWLGLLSQLQDESLSVVLSDRYPNRTALARLQHESEGRLSFVDQPVDATDVPPHLRGFRTLFTAFHHFAPKQAEQIVADAVAAGEGIGIFEVTERRLGAALAVLLVPFVILLITPFVRPFRWSRLFCTYLVPAVPFVGLWDGFVSCLRSYTPDELRTLATSAGGDYEWSAGVEHLPGTLWRVTYLIGVPRLVSETTIAEK